MPELPEVEAVRRALEPQLLGLANEAVSSKPPAGRPAGGFSASHAPSFSSTIAICSSVGVKGRLISTILPS